MNSALNWFRALPRKQKNTLILFVIGLAATGLLLGMQGSEQTGSAALDSGPLYFAGVLAKLVGVLLLFVGCAVVFMRWQKSPRRALAQRRMALEESIRLAPKQSLHLVRVGDQRFLVGATDNGIALISEVEDPVVEAEAEVPAAPAALPSFGQVLQNILPQAGAFKGN